MPGRKENFKTKESIKCEITLTVLLLELDAGSYNCKDDPSQQSENSQCRKELEGVSLLGLRRALVRMSEW